ncbi:MAG: T9SS type A sorting domain-containing protein [Candidatus Eisenbacteria bacterium]|uniref:T9SS type A sorting domain-containing protein n=1 Tax=Eiseniibacteriota bacterium TaxID=2212470 RepID=A0A948RUR3_UNCEI|nr:T9SS type A sorting domain-containing protein [Candidatus Eisenbacteria bacterium]MBU2689923.1 T9SS type A sorting domain-containing protein [Candidatus Eisenbacteria bacterium]
MNLNWIVIRVLIVVLILVMLLLTPSLTRAEEGAVAWIHLSESLLQPQEGGRDNYYIGDGPNIFAFLYVDSVPGGFVSGQEIASKIVIDDASIIVEGFTPIGRWGPEYSPLDEFSEWPTLPGEPIPAAIGYWTLRFLNGRRSQAQISLVHYTGFDGRDSTVIPAIALTGTGTAVPIRSLYGAGINCHPPESHKYEDENPLVQLTWRDRNDRKNRTKFPGGSDWGNLRLDILYPGRIRWGELGVVVRDGEGLIREPIFHLGPDNNPLAMNHGWIADPPEDGPGGPCGYFCFEHPSGKSARRLSIDIPIRLPGSKRPAIIQVPWVVLETPGKVRDTLWASMPDAEVTILEGASAPEALIQAWTPRRIQVGKPLNMTVLGDDLDNLRGFGLNSDHNGYSGLSMEVLRDGRQINLSLASGISEPGFYRLQTQDVWGNHQSTRRGIQVRPRNDGLNDRPVEPGGRDRDNPWWLESVDADYIIVTPDELDDFADLLGDFITNTRKYRVALMRLSEIGENFGIGGVADSLAIKMALAHAYWNWETQPLYALLIGDADENGQDILPTPHKNYDHSTGHDKTFAYDFWYGDIEETSDNNREIVIGRLPCTTFQDILNYRAKLYSYESENTRDLVSFIVGDAYINTNNANRRAAAERLVAYINNMNGGLTPEAIFSFDYQQAGGDWKEAGRQDIIEIFNGTFYGVSPAIVDFFGNNNGYCVVTYFLSLEPCVDSNFNSSQLSNSGALPVIFLSTCLNAAFDEWYSVPEDFLLTPNVGAVAAVGRSHVSDADANEVLQKLFYLELDQNSNSSLGFQLNGSVEGYINSPYCSSFEKKWTAEMTTIFGDPSLVVHTSLESTTLISSFEAAGAVPRQNVLDEAEGWVSSNLEEDCSITRLVHSGVHESCCNGLPEDDIMAVEGQRMMRLCARHVSDGQPEKGAWSIFKPADTSINSQKAILSYWIYQERGPSGQGKVFLDLITESGRKLSEWPITDQYGNLFDPTQRTFPLGEWRHVHARIGSEWLEERIERVVLRYEEPANSNSDVRAYIDELFIGEWTEGTIEGEQNLILNGDFSVDMNADNRPEFWTGPHTNLQALPEAYCVFDGILLSPDVGSPAIMTQLLPEMFYLRDCYDLHFLVKGGDGNTTLAVRLRNLETGEVESEYFFSPTTEWVEYSEYLSAGPPPTILEFEVVEGSAIIDKVRTEQCNTTGPIIPDAEHSIRQEFQASPNPAMNVIRLNWNHPSHTQWSVDVFSLDGRRVHHQAVELMDGNTSVDLNINAGSHSGLPSGVYFVSAKSGDIRYQSRVVLVK